jgi:hypothetical protein
MYVAGIALSNPGLDGGSIVLEVGASPRIAELKVAKRSEDGAGAMWNGRDSFDSATLRS